MYKLIIFDIDGTLVDSSDGIINSINYTVEKLGLKKLSQKELNDFVGFSPLQRAFSHFCEIDDNFAQVCAMTYREHYPKHSANYTKIYSGINELLEILSKKYKLATATYKRLDTAKVLLKHLDLDKYFDFVFGADNENKLTKKDIMNLAIKSCNCKPHEAIMIGDSYHDAKAANELGVEFIGVTYGFGFQNQDEVRQYNPLLIADNAKQIIDFFKLRS